MRGNTASVGLEKGLTASLLRDNLEKEFKIGAAVEIVFQKADGSRRIMKCVKQPEDVGIEYEYGDTTATRKPNDAVCTVWDIDINEWRTFRWDRLESFTVIGA